MTAAVEPSPNRVLTQPVAAIPTQPVGQHGPTVGLEMLLVVEEDSQASSFIADAG